MGQHQIIVLLQMIDQAFDRKSWHGTNLRGSIRGLSAEAASWRPSADRHNIWEVVVHAAYWKYIVRRRLLAEKRGSFPHQGSNWFVRPLGTDAIEDQWKGDVTLLIDTHKSLRETVASMSDRDLSYKPRDSKVSNLELITGIAAHDLYHAGQIQLLKRLTRTG